MARTDKAMALFYDWLDVFESLSAADCKALICSMMRYAKDGTEPPEFHGAAKIAALFIFPSIRRSRENAAAGKRGMESRYHGEQMFENTEEPAQKEDEKPALSADERREKEAVGRYYKRGGYGAEKRGAQREPGFDLNEFFALSVARGESPSG